MNIPKRNKTSINNEQKKLLHVAVRKLQIDDSTYRAMLQSVTGVVSSRDLDLHGFQQVMQHLQDCGFKKTHGDHEFSGYLAALNKWQNSVGERPGMATPAQLARIETDWHLMPWYWSKDGFGHEMLAMRGFLKRCVNAGDLRFLRFGEAHKVIEAIKSIIKRGPKSEE